MTAPAVTRDAHEAHEWSPQPLTFGGAAGNVGVVKQLTGTLAYRVVAVSFRLVTSADVANRLVRVGVRDGQGLVRFVAVAPAQQDASKTVDYSFAPEVPASGSVALGVMTGPFVGGALPPNFAVFVTVGAGVAADRISGGSLLVETRRLVLPGPREYDGG